MSGPKVNKPCVLPFTHNGRTHKKCPIDPDDSSKFWCSTKVDFRGNHVVGKQEYGHCSPNFCPLQGLSATPRPATPAPIIDPKPRTSCSGQTKCKAFVECSSKYRFSKKAKRCRLGDGGIGICCKDLLNNKGNKWKSLVQYSLSNLWTKYTYISIEQNINR